MLTTLEKILFLLALFVTIVLAWRAVIRLIRIIGRGHGKPDVRSIPGRLVSVFLNMVTLFPVFRTRLLTSFFHGLVAWGFLYYVLVNIGDVLQGYIPDFMFLGRGIVGNIYRLGADVLSVGVLVGMIVLIIRRFVFRPPELGVRKTTLLNPKARPSIQRDSAIVGGFILLHVGSRYLGESFHLAVTGPDAWQPFATALSNLWGGLTPHSLEILYHVSWWMALGLILAFIPYFPYSKHIHLFFSPINYLLRPERLSMGQLEPLDFEDESIEQFGAGRLEDLSWSSLMDAYACIMCNRCQDACPAYETGKVLSPSALEINKRYSFNYDGNSFAAGEQSTQMLTESTISPEAVWACTSCGACIDICPVGNEPMRDILEIRRHLVLMENKFPEQLQTAFRGMERTANPWNIPPEQRLEWAEGLQVPIVAENPGAEWLWWVGCAPATDVQAQKIARAFVEVLQAGGVNYAVLGPEERCTGDSARRAGNEYLFAELAASNVETLNRVAPKRIVTTCPHCMHVLKNEYPAFGGHYNVVHHSQLIKELLDQGKLKLDGGNSPDKIAYHDPCYLGRHNGVYEAARHTLRAAGIELIELPRHKATSFCCGAGGAQMWKEEEEGTERVSANRLKEALASGAETLTASCPFCVSMLGDAARDVGVNLQVRDVVELIAEQL